ncbi:hypothetical protein D9757_004624 [Collybiopsis confluens]|uniref:C2H2-type domain-containing protein n=1 Tax=Collybiopsis confluens TaxID=2823264 RepID=A0A8H5HSM2_9AGAR|nr:hypothetical protein D9757_004624 [Collybiopsis confluens]
MVGNLRGGRGRTQAHLPILCLHLQYVCAASSHMNSEIIPDFDPTLAYDENFETFDLLPVHQSSSWPNQTMAPPQVFPVPDIYALNPEGITAPPSSNGYILPVAQSHSPPFTFTTQASPPQIVPSQTPISSLSGSKVRAVGSPSGTQAAKKRRTRPPASQKFLCTVVGCGAELTSKQNLKYHLAYHSNLKAYQCTECGKAFVTPSDMKRHRDSTAGCKKKLT